MEGLTEKDRYIWKVVCEWLREEHIRSKAAAYILYAMAAFKKTYKEALHICADFVGDAPQRVHAQICYAILCTDYECGPETFFQTFLEERDFDD